VILATEFACINNTSDPEVPLAVDPVKGSPDGNSRGVDVLVELVGGGVFVEVDMLVDVLVDGSVHVETVDGGVLVSGDLLVGGAMRGKDM
jgi:hypothetical protein